MSKKTTLDVRLSLRINAEQEKSLHQKMERFGLSSKAELIRAWADGKLADNQLRAQFEIEVLRTLRHDLPEFLEKSMDQDRLIAHQITHLAKCLFVLVSKRDADEKRQRLKEVLGEMVSADEPDLPAKPVAGPNNF